MHSSSIAIIAFFFFSPKSFFLSELKKPLSYFSAASAYTGLMAMSSSSTG